MSEQGTDIDILKDFKLRYHNSFCELGLMSEQRTRE